MDLRRALSERHRRCGVRREGDAGRAVRQQHAGTFTEGATMSKTYPATPPQTRLLCAFAAFATTGVLTASILGLFEQASPDVWLAATPELLAEVSRCEQIAGRVQRTDCINAVVVAHASRTGAPLRLASRP